MSSGLIRDRNGAIPAFPIHKDTYQGTPTDLDLSNSELFIVLMSEAGVLTATFPEGQVAVNLLEGAAVALDKTVTSLTSTVPIILS